MQYELAKQLKDAGFLGITLPDVEECIIDGEWGTHQPEADYPTLSELIEACGEDFRNLVLHTQYRKKLEKPWDAVPNKKRRPECKGQTAKTPEEAVAKLWLELHGSTQ